MQQQEYDDAQQHHVGEVGELGEGALVHQALQQPAHGLCVLIEVMSQRNTTLVINTTFN